MSGINNQLEEVRFLPDEAHERARVIINDRFLAAARRSALEQFGEDNLYPPVPVSVQPEQITQPMAITVSKVVETDSVKPLTDVVTRLDVNEIRARIDRINEGLDEAA